MWFRRKKKADPDSALTETLRSLQVLLEDDEGSIEQTPAKKNNSTVNKPASQTAEIETDVSLPKQETPTDAPPLSAASEQATVVAAEPNVHATSGAPANHKMADNEATSTASAQAPWDDGIPDDSDPRAGVENEQPNTEEDLVTPLDTLDNQEASEESTWVDPFREDDSPVTEDLVLEFDSEDLADQDVEVPVIDTIPVLTNVVFEPVIPPANATQTDTVDREMLLEVCVNDLRERLRQNNLTQMDGEQEQRLRQILTYILGNKSTGHSE